MINNFHEVNDQLYRGAAPSPKDVLWLKEKYGIKKIVSLDEQSGKKIDRTTKLLGIEHIILPINGTKKSLLNFLHHDLKKLLLEDGPTFVHCKFGKDRTGLAIALLKCKYLGVSKEDALKEAFHYGFGRFLEPEIKHLYEKIIMSCKSEEDINNADIVSNEREYKSDNYDTFLMSHEPSSFAPASPVGTHPIYNSINDQSPTRDNYDQKIEIKKDISVPLVGTYNNDAGAPGAGYVLNPGGFIYD